MQVQTTTANIITGVTETQIVVAPTAPKKVKVAPEVIKLNRVALKSLIEKQDGLFVSVDFVKLDGSIRTLTGRLGVKSYLKGGSNTVEASDRPYLTMFDVQLRQYRTVNLATVREMRANSKIYQIVD